MTPELALYIIQFAATAAAAVLIFIGLRLALKRLDKNEESKTIPKEILTKSTKIVVIGVVCYAVARFAANYLPMKALDPPYDDLYILIQSAWQALYTLGFTALIPLIINRLHVNRLKAPEK